ncbi:MFS transporter [Listeria rocourtiae]|uniref:MFS transporter n=1 Tax=Listeria rocourtiae TaxID=647910 RepID=UPI00162A8815|nr:MFS transporter [Listeria rocourtiae]MBC1604420.1 MFS transporter [Listeria rocourtiae]
MNRASILLILSSFVSFVGSGIFFISITWYVYKMSGNSTSVGMIVLLSSVPGIFISPIAGVIADRFNKKRIVILMDILRWFLIVSVFSLEILGLLTTYYLYFVTVAVTICSNLFFPSFSGLIKVSVDKEKLSRVMSANSTGLQLGTIIGSSLAGLLIATVSIQGSFLICSISYVLSAMLLGGIKNKEKHIDWVASEGHNNKVGLFSSLLDGFTYIRDNTNIRILILLGLITGTIVSAINTLLSAYTVEVLNSSEKVYGILDASYAFGGVIVGVLLVITKVKIPFMKSLLMSTFTLALSFLLLGIFSSIIVSIITLSIIGLANMYQGVIRKTKLIGITDVNYIGRVESVNWLVYSTISPIIALLLGVSANVVSIDKIFLLVGVALIILFFAILIFGSVYAKEKYNERNNVNE